MLVYAAGQTTLLAIEHWPYSNSLMILPSEKDKNVTDGEAETLTPSYPGDRQPESSSSYRDTAPPTPFENVPPPYSNGPAISPNQSYYAPVNPTTVAAMSIPRAPGMRPVSFSRLPSGHLTYPTFQPMFLVATGKTLDKGFPYASPPSNLNPHPFASHDVSERDWVRYLFVEYLFLFCDLLKRKFSFLEDGQKGATLTEKQIGRSHLPIVSRLPIVGEFLKNRSTCGQFVVKAIT